MKCTSRLNLWTSVLTLVLLLLLLLSFGQIVLIFQGVELLIGTFKLYFVFFYVYLPEIFDITTLHSLQQQNSFSIVIRLGLGMAQNGFYLYLTHSSCLLDSINISEDTIVTTYQINIINLFEYRIKNNLQHVHFRSHCFHLPRFVI